MQVTKMDTVLILNWKLVNVFRLRRLRHDGPNNNRAFERRRELSKAEPENTKVALRHIKLGRSLENAKRRQKRLIGSMTSKLNFWKDCESIFSVT